jgi:hypothetical protein
MSEGTDKRSVSTDALETLGTLIDDTQKRDAIHLAVEPVVAGELLMPGDDINVAGGVAKLARRGEGLGIVDPFLRADVQKGQRFWFVMKPRQVRSLRHVWTHPAFEDEPEVARAPVGPSQAYIDQLAGDLGMDSDELIFAAKNYVDYDEYLNHGPRFDGESIPYEFWEHFEAVTGRKVPEDKKSSFLGCSC